MGDYKAAKPAPAEVKRSQEMWDSFTNAGKYSVYAIIGVLVLMALTLL